MMTDIAVGLQIMFQFIWGLKGLAMQVGVLLLVNGNVYLCGQNYRAKLLCLEQIWDINMQVLRSLVGSVTRTADCNW